LIMVSKHDTIASSGGAPPDDANDHMRTSPQEMDDSNSMGLGESALAIRAKTDERAREELILRQEKNILRIVSLAKHGFASRSDDEWSIALCAFSHAIDTYSTGRGAFVPYAEMLMKRSLIDEYRAQSRRIQELPVSPEIFDGWTEDDESNAVLAVVVENSVRAADTTLRDEIIAANAALKRFGFSFFELTDCSPTRESTRDACLTIAEAVLSNQDILEQMMRKKQLPLRHLASIHGAARKLMERYRRYIIATIVICAGEYPALTRYIRGERGKV
jgi:RNA polymerase sigma factor